LTNGIDVLMACCDTFSEGDDWLQCLDHGVMTVNWSSSPVIVGYDRPISVQSRLAETGFAES